MTDPTPKAVVVPIGVLSEAAGLLELEGYGPVSMALLNCLAAPQASLSPVEGGREAASKLFYDWLDERDIATVDGDEGLIDSILAALSPVPSSVGSAAPVDGNTVGVSDSPTPAPSEGGEPVPEDDEAEAYEIGKRDGYEQAMQEIDLLTGGDGEYRFCTDGDPERHTPDAATMKARIVKRFTAPSAPGEPLPDDGEKLRADRSKLLEAWTDFLDANPDGVTSPEEWPDHALVTFDQMADFVDAAFARSALEGSR